MSTRTETPTARPAVAGVKGARILIVESRYYTEIAESLIEGDENVIGRNGALSERVVVPGAFEIPGAIALAADHYDGFVALGCVIRGETTHYDYVCGESARGLMDLSVRERLAIGYGIVDTSCTETRDAVTSTAWKSRSRSSRSSCFESFSKPRAAARRPRSSP